MALTVSIEAPPGTTVTDYEFQPGELISVKCTDHEVVDFADQEVDIIITFADGSQALNERGTLSIWSGNFSARFTLPETITQGTITVTLTTGGSQTNQVLEIGVGTIGTNPKPPKVAASWVTALESSLKWVAIGAGVIAVIWIASKALPDVSKSLAKGAVKK
jgi:hypothetical protein